MFFRDALEAIKVLTCDDLNKINLYEVLLVGLLRAYHLKFSNHFSYRSSENITFFSAKQKKIQLLAAFETAIIKNDLLFFKALTKNDHKLIDNDQELSQLKKVFNQITFSSRK